MKSCDPHTRRDIFYLYILSAFFKDFLCDFLLSILWNPNRSRIKLSWVTVFPNVGEDEGLPVLHVPLQRGVGTNLASLYVVDSTAWQSHPAYLRLRLPYRSSSPVATLNRANTSNKPWAPRVTSIIKQFSVCLCAWTHMLDVYWASRVGRLCHIRLLKARLLHRTAMLFLFIILRTEGRGSTYDWHKK